jgi:hypothetical protein
MVQRPYMRLILIIIMSLAISLPMGASAEEVGNFTRVEKRVDYLKGGTGPATPAAVKKPVEVRDVIHTHDLSRAQVEFRDKSTIIIAPLSKVAIENYMFDPNKFERNAQIDLVQGVMKVVVPVLEKGAKSEFTIKTSTAIMGVRGTEFIVISGTNFTVVYVTKGRVCIKCDKKEPGKYELRRADPGTPPEPEEICLDPGTMSVILKDQLPSTPQPVSAEVMALAEGLVLTGFREIPGTCNPYTLPGVNLELVVNDLLARGADLESVRRSLAAVNCLGAETYAYSPPEPPLAPAGVGPTFPGGGGGGPGPGPGAGPGPGGGGVASPAQ